MVEAMEAMLLSRVSPSPRDLCLRVDIVGPSNLITLLETIPPYWKPVIEQFTKEWRLPNRGRPEAVAGTLTLNYVDRIERPLLIGQGANDPGQAERVGPDRQGHAGQEPAVTYVLYSDEAMGSPGLRIGSLLCHRRGVSGKALVRV